MSWGHHSPQALSISPQLLYSLRKDLRSLKAVGETEAQVLWQRRAETSSGSGSSLNKAVALVLWGERPLCLPSMGLRPLYLPLAILFSCLLKSPDWPPLLQPCQGPTLWPPGPALGFHSIITLRVALPSGLSASHQTEGSDRILLVAGASVPSPLKMLSKFPVIEGESVETVEERVEARGGNPGLYYTVTDEENSRTL